MTAERVYEDLRKSLGERVHRDKATLTEHERDTWPLSIIRAHQSRLAADPGCVVRPGGTEDVARVLAYANESRVPVVPFGAGSGVCGGILPENGAIVLDLRDMNQMLDLNETALTVRVQAGMMGGVFEEELQKRGYTMGHFPQSIDLSTVGGWVATRAAGQFSTRYGNIEDMLLGLEVVLADGRVIDIKPATRRSAGPDPRHLFLGCEGTLGVITELTLRILPLPESRRLLCYRFADFDAGLEASRTILRNGWRPPVVRLYDGFETARHFGEWSHGTDECFLILVSEGPRGLTAAEAEGCQQACEAFGGQAAGDAPVQQWLKDRNKVPSLEDLVAKGFVVDTIEVAAAWDCIHDVYHEVVKAVKPVKDLMVVSGHSSHSYTQGTNIYFTFVARPQDPANAEATYLECWKRTMEATLRCGGSISHHHGIGRLRMPWMKAEHGEALELLRVLKQALDPKGILNPGVLLPEQ